MADGGSQYKYKLIIDAEEAQATAARLRQMIEGELSQMDLGQAMARAQGTSGGGGMAGAVAQTQAAIKSADQQLDEMAQKFAKMDAHELRAGMTQAVADARELRSVLEGVKLPSMKSEELRSKLNEFYANYEKYTSSGGVHASAEFIAARNQGLVPHMGALKMGTGEIDSAKMPPPGEWSVNAVGAVQEARTSEQEYAQAQVKYYEALATEAKAGEALLEKLVGEMSSDAGMARVLDEYEQLDAQTQRWAQNEAEALGGLGSAQAELARITQEVEAEAQAAVTKAQNLSAVSSGNLGGLAGGGGGADATIRITATSKAADAYDRIAQSVADIAVNSERISKAEASSVQSVAANATHYAEMESARRKEEMSARNAMAIAEKQVEIQRTSTQQAKTQTQEQAALAQLARAAATEQVEAQRRLSAVTSAETAERKQDARAEATERIELARQTTATVKGEQQRETANLREELRQQRTAVQQSSVMSVGGVTGGMSRLGRGLVGAGIGALGLYGIEGTARTLYNAGEQGAQQLRTMETFEALAQRIGVSADEMVGAVKSAANDTITEFDAISYGAQILAQRFATSSEDIVGDTAKLIEFSRRLSQIYTDEQGNFMSTQEVFGRLVKFTREGNKELVDQFGLSNKLIADIMNVPVDGLASATGAITRWQGMLKFAGQEMERLGPSTASVADEFQASSARITDSINAMRQAAAKPVSIAVDYAASGVGWLAFDAINRGDQGYKQNFDTMREFGGTNQTDREISQAEERLKNARKAGMGRISEDSSLDWTERAQAASKYNDQIERMAAIYQTIAGLAHSGDLDATEAQAAAEAWEKTISGLASGATGVKEAGDAASELEKMINAAADATVFVQSGADGMAASIGGAADEAARLAGELAAALTPYQQLRAEQGRSYSVTDPQLAAMSDAERAAYQRNQNNARSLEALAATGASDPYASTSRSRAHEQLAQLYDDQAKLEEQIAKERTALDKQTATAAESAWRSAAAKTQQAFDSAISKIPGIGGTSAVTEEDMAKAKAGLAVNYADDYLRRLEDEIVNKKDWAGVDVGDAARRMGMDPSTDPNVVLQQMKSQWSSGELFAGGNNLDLVNLDAVKAAYEQQARQEDGQKELRKYVGQALGINVDAMDAQASATYATTNNTSSLDENTAALDAVNQQIAELNAAPAPGTAPAVGAAATPAPYQYTDAQQKVWADAQAYAARQKAKEEDPAKLIQFMGGAVPIEGGRMSEESKADATKLIQFMGGAVPIEGGGMSKKSRQEWTDVWANQDALLAAELQATGGPGTGSFDIPGALRNIFMGGATPESTMTPAAIGEAVAEAMSQQALTTGGMVPNAMGGFSPTVGMPNPAGLIDLLATQAGPLAAIADAMMGSPTASARNSGPQDMVAGTTVYTPWASSLPGQVPLPPVDAQGYGRPLIPGLDTPPGLTSGHMTGDTLTTPAPYTDIRKQPTTGLGGALLPSWLTDATTETVSKGTGTTLYLPLVANQAEIDTALGSQPEDIATRMMDRISLSFGDVEVVAPLWSGWQKDLSNNGDKLEETGISVGKLFQGGFIKGLKGDGNFVAEIVAAVLESLAGQDQ